MKTTTTRAIMNRAHAITRATVQPGDSYSATFSLALRQAWEEAKAPSARAAWESMSGEEQHLALVRMVWTRRRKCAAETDSAGNYRRDPYRWMRDSDDVEQVVNAAWILMIKALDAAEKRESETGSKIPLALVMGRACDRAADKTGSAETKRPRADRIDAETGETYIEDAPRPDPIAPNPETAVITIDALRRACADSIDARIMRRLACGDTQRETASALGITPSAVNQRLRKMRDRYSEIMFECTWDELINTLDAMRRSR